MKPVFRTAIFMAAVTLIACGKTNNSSSADYIDEVSDGIIGGTDLSSSDPISQTIVAVYDTQVGGLCTGSIIADDLVMTAGHCVGSNPRNLILIFGTNIRNSQANNRKVSQALVNARFSQVGKLINQGTAEESIKNWGDIAILRFSGGLPVGFKPAQLLKSTSSLQNGGGVVLAGYGINSGVQKTGSGMLRKVGVKIANAKFASAEVELDQRQGTGACHGDSGGPAYVNIAGNNLLFGVTSRGHQDPNDQCSQFSIYTNATALASWITKTSASLRANKL